MDQEQVLCVYRAVVERLRPWKGWTDFDPNLWEQASTGGTLIQRNAELEANTDLLQIIVYGVVSYDDEHGENRTLVYCRGKGGSEDRLYRKLSLGIGGHVNRDDVLLGKDTITRSAMRRELKEELGLAPRDDQSLTPWGILFDSSVKTGVTAVHLGQVFEIRVAEADIDQSKIESACEVVGWLTEEEIRAMYFTDPFEFEDWSRWVIQGSMLTMQERHSDTMVAP